MIGPFPVVWTLINFDLPLSAPISILTWSTNIDFSASSLRVKLMDIYTDHGTATK